MRKMMPGPMQGGDSTAAPPQSPGRAEPWNNPPCGTALQAGWMGPDEAETLTLFFSLVNLLAPIMITMKFSFPFAMCFC